MTMKRTALFLIYMTVAMLMAAQSSFVPYEWSKSTDSNGKTI